MAIPADQYIAAPKVPLNVWALAEVSNLYPVTTVAAVDQPLLLVS